MSQPDEKRIEEGQRRKFQFIEGTSDEELKEYDGKTVVIDYSDDVEVGITFDEDESAWDVTPEEIGELVPDEEAESESEKSE